MIYEAYQSHVDLLHPFASLAQSVPLVFRDARGGLRGWPPLRRFAAACDVLALARLRHRRPAFDIGSVAVGRRQVSVREERTCGTPFATLLHFRKEVRVPQPR